MTSTAPHLLAVARHYRALSQRDLARLSGMTQVGISHIESGRVKQPHGLSKRALAEALHFEVADIWPASGRTKNAELRTHAKELKKHV